MESFGARLKREREQRKISLDDISVSTKIGTRFLSAIEEEQFDQLPGGIFSKGFVRAYARYLGIDEAQAVADYVTASGASLPEAGPEESSEPAVPEVQEPEPGDGVARIPWGMLAIAILLVAFSFTVWGFHSRDRSVRPRAIIPPPVDVNGSTAPQNVAQNIPAKPAEVISSAPPQSAAPEPAAGGLPTRTHSVSPDAATNPGAFLVQIKAREDSWVAISADGKEIMQDTLHASAEKSIGARDEIVIKTGNAGALDISFNGKKLPSQGSSNEVKRLTFDPNGLRPQGR